MVSVRLSFDIPTVYILVYEIGLLINTWVLYQVVLLVLVRPFEAFARFTSGPERKMVSMVLLQN